MKLSRFPIISVLSVLVFHFPSAVRADPSPDDLESVLSRLTMGERIKVEGGGEVLEGRFGGLGDAGLRVDSGAGSRDVPAESIEIVWEKDRRFWAGAYKGAVIGGTLLTSLAGLGLAALGEGDGYTTSDFAIGTVVVGGLGAVAGGLIGGGVGALVTHWVPLYDPAGAGTARRITGRTGSAGIAVSGGFLTPAGAPDGSVGVQGRVLAWGGRIAAFGPEIGYQALGDGLGSFRAGGVLVLSTPTRPFAVHGTAGVASYFSRYRREGGNVRFRGDMGASLGGGVSYELSRIHRVRAEVRHHWSAADYPGLDDRQVTFSLGIEARW